MTLDAARRAALDIASEEAAGVLREAEREAAAVTAAAEAEAARILERARERGREAARRAGAERRAQARASARERVMAARRSAYERLCAESRRAALKLRDEDDYPALLAQLAAAAHERLGPGTEIESDVPERGGVHARRGSRSVDLTLETLAERSLATLGGDVASLWSA